MKKFLPIIITTFGFFVFASNAHAAASLSLSPASGSYGQGQKFTVSINVNTGGDAVNAVEAVVTFPADKLKADYVSHSGSGFDIVAESTVGSGVVRISKGKMPPSVVGSRRVATVGFTALSQGSASVAITGESKVLREADSGNILSGTGGATFNIGQASASAPGTSTQPKTPVQGGTPKQVSTESARISDIKVSKLEMDAVTIDWKTDKRADSLVEYGFVSDRSGEKANYFFTSQNNEMVTGHQIVLDQKTLIPGYLYYYKVVSKDANSNISASERQTFILPGYKAKVKVNDSLSRPVSGAKVKLPAVGVTGETNNGGEVEFSDLPLDNLAVIVDFDGQIKEGILEVSKDKESQLTLVLGQKVQRKTGNAIFALIGLAILVIAAGAFLAWKYFKGKKGKDQPMAPVDPTAQSSK